MRPGHPGAGQGRGPGRHDPRLSIDVPDLQRPVCRRGEAAGRIVTTPSLADFDILTFDCYGILTAFRTVLAGHGAAAGDDQLLEGFAGFEAAAEAGPYLPYREVLARALRGVCTGLGFEPTSLETAGFSESVGDWPAFPDSAAA